MENHCLHIENLRTGFNQKRREQIVLQKNISADLKTGELICLLGPNGAGKSTMMRTLLGLQKELKGSVAYDDHSLSQITEKQLARHVAVVLTGGLEDIYLTAYEVVAMGRYPFAPFSGKLKTKDRQAINEALEQVEMSLFSQKIFYTLSDGEKQKVLIARALVQETPFIFFDEPAVYIDAPGKIAIMELLTEIVRKKNKGILLTTHDVDLALQYADRLWLLGKKLPFVQGIPEDLVLKKTIRQYFYHHGIVFDTKQGKFIKENQKNGRKIYVAGKSASILWLSKALVRKGYQVENVDKQSLTNGIFFENDAFMLFQNNHLTGNYKTIEKVLENIKVS